MGHTSIDKVLEMAGKVQGEGTMPAFLMGKEMKLTIGGVDVTKWLHDAEFANEPGAFSIKMQFTLPAEQPKPKSLPYFAEASPSQYPIYDEASPWLSSTTVLDKVAKEMIEKQKGTPA